MTAASANATSGDTRPVVLITGAAGNLGRTLAAALAADYRIAVTEAKDGSRVTVQSGDGKPEQSEVATRILTVLLEDLK